MSLKKKAAQVQRAGRKNIGEDSVLAHISPEEALRLKMQGGSGRPDPQTGLPHFNEDGDGEAGGSGVGGMGSGYGLGGGFGGLSSIGQTADPTGFNNFDTEGTIGGNGYGTEADGMNGGENATGYTGLDSIYDPSYGGFSPANDSQAANVDNGFAANSDFSGPVDYGNTTSTMDSLFDPRRIKNFAINQIASKLGVPGAVMGLGRAAMGSSPAETASSFGSTAGGMFGAVGGPLGSMAGSAIGSALGGYEAGRTDAGRAEAGAGMNATNAAQAGGGLLSNWGNIDLPGTVSGIAALFQGNKAANTTQQAANVAQQQTQTLANIYGQDSPYAAALRQQLDRRDAAAGRRSQYGPREVELQAALANAAVKAAPSVLAANKDAATYGQQTQTTTAQRLASLASLGKATGLTDYANKGLKDLFGNTSSAPTGVGDWTPTGYSNAPAATGNGDFGYGNSGSNFMDTVSQWFD